MMKKNFRILTLVLSCLLLIGVMVGISVSASEEPTVAIARKSISYEGAVKIAYAIDAQNIADDQEVKLLFSYDEMTTPTGKLDETEYEYVNGISGTQTLDGVTYLLAFSDGFAPAEMTKPVYALPVVVDGEGNIITSGTSHKLSIFEYCTTRFSGSYTDDQLELYKALLHYGASVQEALVGTSVYPQEELDKYGWADAFYITNITTKVDGVVDSTETVCYRESDITIEAPKTYNGKIFNGFADEEGNALTMYGSDNTASSWNKYKATLPIGVTELTYNYKTAGTLQTWDNVAAITGSNLVYQQSGSNVAFDTKETDKTAVYLEDGKLNLTNRKWVPITLANKNETAGAVGKTYVFESDIFFDFDYANSKLTGSTRLAYFDFSKSAGDGYNTHFVRFVFNWDDAATKSNRFMMRYFDGAHEHSLFSLEFNKWQNLRIEYTITSLKDESKGDVKVYLNGELVANIEDATPSVAGRDNSAFGGFHYEGNHTNCGEYNLVFDNTYLATED